MYRHYRPYARVYEVYTALRVTCCNRNPCFDLVPMPPFPFGGRGVGGGYAFALCGLVIQNRLAHQPVYVSKKWNPPSEQGISAASHSNEKVECQNCPVERSKAQFSTKGDSSGGPYSESKFMAVEEAMIHPSLASTIGAEYFGPTKSISSSRSIFMSQYEPRSRSQRRNIGSLTAFEASPANDMAMRATQRPLFDILSILIGLHWQLA
jgi:hypothetical protein